MQTEIPSSLQIAQDATLRPILEIAEEAGLAPDEVETYGRYKAKVDLSVLERLSDRPDAKVVPMEDLNLHFTGDLHAITAANNLLAALIDAHVLHGNAAGLDPLAISWRRCLDMNDRSLRDVVTALGGRANGYPRQTGFDITAASEIMALVAVARDLADLRERLGKITVGQTYAGERVTAEQIRAAGSLAVLRKG